MKKKCCYTPTVLLNEQQPAGFETWSTQITFESCYAVLPNGTKFDTRMYLDMSDNFDTTSYTNFLVERYKETL